MRSQSLFNFFTKAADVRQTAAGTRIHTGASAAAAKANMAAAGNAAYNAEQKRRSGMTQEQRWDEDFNNHLSDQAGAGKDQYNFAYDNYSRDLDDAVVRGSMTQQQAAKARQHIINGVRARQRQFHSDYLASYNNGDHTDSDRQGIRNTKIRTVHGDNGLVHFRHGDFGENTTFGGAERGYAQRDARAAASGGRGGVGVRGGARGGTSQMINNSVQTARPNDAYRYSDMRYGTKQPAQAKPQISAAPVATDPASTTARQGNAMLRGGTPANASNVTPTAPPSPITFKGGYTVGGVSGDVDWAAKGDGSINVGGAKLTADQYNAFNNVRSSLATQLRQQEGLSHTEARARATQMANQWMADQTAVANGGKAQNRWQHVESPKQTAQPEAAAQPEAQPAVQPSVATQPEAQPAAPATPPQAPGGEIKSMVSFAEPAAGQNTATQPGEQAAQPDGAAEQQPLVRTISNSDIMQRWGDGKFTTNNYITSHRQNAHNNVLRLHTLYRQRDAAGADVSELRDIAAQLKEQAQLYAYLKDQGTLPYGDKAMTAANLDYWNMKNMKRRASWYDADDIAKWVNLPNYVFK